MKFATWNYIVTVTFITIEIISKCERYCSQTSNNKSDVTISILLSFVVYQHPKNRIRVYSLTELLMLYSTFQL